MTTRQEFINFIYPIDLEEIIRVNEEEINLHEVTVSNLDSIEEVSNLVNRLEEEKDNADLWGENRRTIHLPNLLLRLKGLRQCLIYNREEEKQKRVERREKWGKVYLFKDSSIEGVSVADLEEAFGGKIVRLYQEFDEFLEVDREYREEGKPITCLRKNKLAVNRVRKGLTGSWNVTNYRRITEWYRREIPNLEVLKEKVEEVVSWKSVKLVHLLEENHDFCELFNTLKKIKSSIEASEETISDRKQKLSFLFRTEIFPPLPNEPKDVIKESYFKQLEEEKMTKFKLAEFESKYRWREWNAKLKDELKQLLLSAKKETIDKIKNKYTFSLYECVTDLFLLFREEVNKLEALEKIQEQEIEELLAKEIKEYQEQREQYLTTKPLPELPKKQSKIKKLGNKLKTEFKQVVKPKGPQERPINNSSFNFLLLGILFGK